MSIKNKTIEDEEYEQSRWLLWHELDKVAYEGSDEELKKFLDLFTIDDYSKIPIIATLVSCKRIRILKFLYKKGIPFINIDNNNNLLSIACGASGSSECVKFLVETLGFIDVHHECTSYRETPYTLAVSYNHKDIVNYLEEKLNIEYIKVRHLKVILETKEAIIRKHKLREEFFNRIQNTSTDKL